MSAVADVVYAAESIATSEHRNDRAVREALSEGVADPTLRLMLQYTYSHLWPQLRDYGPLPALPKDADARERMSEAFPREFPALMEALRYGVDQTYGSWAEVIEHAISKPLLQRVLSKRLRGIDRQLADVWGDLDNVIAPTARSREAGEELPTRFALVPNLDGWSRRVMVVRGNPLRPMWYLVDPKRGPELPFSSNQSQALPVPFRAAVQRVPWLILSDDPSQIAVCLDGFLSPEREEFRVFDLVESAHFESTEGRDGRTYGERLKRVETLLRDDSVRQHNVVTIDDPSIDWDGLAEKVTDNEGQGCWVADLDETHPGYTPNWIWLHEPTA